VIIEDTVLFIMPEDKEYQFAAVSILQFYVNVFQDKMKNSYPQPPDLKFKLHYDVQIDPKDWKFWQRAELSLVQDKEPIGYPDAIFDFSNERIDLFKGSGKHVGQVCGLMCGVGCPPLPEIRKVQPKLGGEWIMLNPGVPHVDLLELQDEQVAGVIGEASWETYLACAMNLPTVEILPVGRPRTWLSKYTSAGYRVVDAAKGDVGLQIDQAVKSLEQLTRYLKQQNEIRKQREQMCSQPPVINVNDKDTAVRSMCTANSAVNSSVHPSQELVQHSV
jgi:hypothetical protein